MPPKKKTKTYLFRVEWQEKHVALISAESESAARQCYIDGVFDPGEGECIESKLLSVKEVT